MLIKRFDDFSAASGIVWVTSFDWTQNIAVFWWTEYKNQTLLQAPRLRRWDVMKCSWKHWTLLIDRLNCKIEFIDFDNVSEQSLICTSFTMTHWNDKPLSPHQVFLTGLRKGSGSLCLLVVSVAVVHESFTGVSCQTYRTSSPSEQKGSAWDKMPAAWHELVGWKYKVTLFDSLEKHMHSRLLVA